MLETPKSPSFPPSRDVWTKKRWEGRRELFNFAFLHLFHPPCQLLLGSTAVFYHIFHFSPSLNCYQKHSILLYKRVNSSLVSTLSLRGEISVPERLVCLPLCQNRWRQTWETLRKRNSKHLWLSGVYFCDHRFNSWFSYTVGSIVIVHYLIIIQYADQYSNMQYAEA